MAKSAEERIIEEVSSMSDEELDREWRAVGGAPAALRWVKVLGMQYHRIIQHKRSNGVLSGDRVLRRYKLAILGNADGLRRESDFLTPKYEERAQKGDTMKKTKKDAKEARTTVSSILIKMLGAASVKSDETIIKDVKDQTGSTKFDSKQLAWYKWKYRQGKLKGMDGKAHVIEQGNPKKEPRKLKKKVLIKDRRKEKALEL